MQVRKKITNTKAKCPIYLTLSGVPIARQCNSCMKILPAAKFNPLRVSKLPQPTCKKCKKDNYKPPESNYTHELHYRRLARSDEEIAETRKKIYPDNLKTCFDCGEPKTLDNFYHSKVNLDALHNRCKPCYIRRQRK